MPTEGVKNKYKKMVSKLLMAFLELSRETDVGAGLLVVPAKSLSILKAYYAHLPSPQGLLTPRGSRPMINLDMEVYHKIARDSSA